MTAPDPADTIDGQPEWDDPDATWVHNLLRDDGDDPWTGAETDNAPAPMTLSELVLVPTYTQSAWERRMVQWLQTGEDAETYLWHNLHKTDETLIYDLLLMLGFERAAHTYMDRAATVTGAVYGSMTAPAAKPKPKRRRPSQARKTTGGT
jgi:hypothetical protein